MPNLMPHGAAPPATSQRADIPGRLRVAQFDVLSQLAPGSAAIGLSAAVMLAVVFWRNGPHHYLAVLITLLAAGYGVSVVYTIAWYARPRPATLPAALMRVRISLSALLGLLWATVPVALGSYADRDQRLLLGYMIAGLGTAGPLMAPVLPAALLFIGPIMCGAAVDALTSDIQVAGSVVGLIIGYGVLVSLATVALNRRFRDQVTNGIALTEQREIISLLLRDFEESSSDWLWQTDADGRLIDVSDRVAEALGRTREALEGCDLVACWDHRATDQPVTREAWLRLKAVLAQPAAFRDLVLPLSVAGSARWLSLTGKPIHDRDGKFLGFRGVGADITAARQSEARIRHLAANDSLTDLPNRATLTEALRHACDSGAPFALLCVDLDEFKIVNDTLGHAAGDALLVAATQRMLHCLRSGDILARLGGDEFALLQPGGDAASAERLGRRLVEHLSEPFSLDGVPAAVGASVGAALAPTDGSTPDALMKAADLALYRAKHDGRGTLRFFQTEMSHSAQARSAMQADLRQALGRGQLSLHYQPVLDLAGERIVVMEALASSGARRDQPGGICPARRRGRADRGDRHLGAARGLHGRRRLAAAGPGGGEPVAGAGARPRAAGHRRCSPCGGRAAAQPAGAGDHGIAVPGGDGRDPHLPARAACPRHPHRFGRFRDRLFQPELPALVPVRQGQDRPLLRARHRRRRQCGGDRAGDHRDGGQPGHDHHRGGDRDVGPGSGAARPRLRPGAGFSV
jgi:diguanylate cyclase (GGDEF)-like protein/PAS domain S-box-containing protein